MRRGEQWKDGEEGLGEGGSASACGDAADERRRGECSLQGAAWGSERTEVDMQAYWRDSMMQCGISICRYVPAPFSSGGGGGGGGGGVALLPAHY